MATVEQDKFSSPTGERPGPRGARDGRARGESARRSVAVSPPTAPRSPRGTAATRETSPLVLAGADRQWNGHHDSPGQRIRGRGLPAYGARGDRPARAARHPRQQRRHHLRQDRSSGWGRGSDEGPFGQPLRRVLHVQGGAGAHARARQRSDHQHLLDRRPDRQYRPDQLRGVQVGHVRHDDDDGARGRVATSRAPVCKIHTGSG